MSTVQFTWDSKRHNKVRSNKTEKLRPDSSHIFIGGEIYEGINITTLQIVHMEFLRDVKGYRDKQA
jgi:hypothetical protein